MRLTSRHCYQFSGFHSLIIGLLPFFIPVLLWHRGYSIAYIAAFISLTGVSFMGTLWCWDRLRARRRWKTIILLSFIAELMLVGLLATETNEVAFVALALINGTYNGFYWSTQRAMFNQITTEGNTGRTFGNIQILAVVALKVGILIGGYLLENHNITPIFMLSLAIASMATWQLLSTSVNTDAGQQTDTLTVTAAEEPALSLTDILHFKDGHRSKITFLLDGPFLFLESYFWVLSLYFLTQQSFFNLGAVIVSLILLLSLVFYFIKNKIDNIDQQKIYIFAVTLYALSWFLRGELSTRNSVETSNVVLYSTMLVIGFLTTFFRLVFNKRFFDIARNNTPYRYLLCKSYYSQGGVALMFGLFSLLLFYGIPSQNELSVIYFSACPLALIYSIYTTKVHVSKNSSTHRFSFLTHPLLSFKKHLTARYNRSVNKR